MSTKLSPSYYGYVGSTKDALLIIQSILNKQLNLIPRRPHERERLDLIKSGNVFIFIEEHSGIKRWTDGISWSPSRILGRFLVYRELDKELENNNMYQSAMEMDKKRKKKRSYDEFEINNIQHGFKDQGLIKKTLSITTNLKEFNNVDKQTIHLISYYNANDVINGKLCRPSESDLKNLQIDKHLWDAIKESNLGGKVPIEDEAYYFLDNNYQLQNMSKLSQPPYSQQIPQMPHQQIPSIPQVPSQVQVPQMQQVSPQIQQLQQQQQIPQQMHQQSIPSINSMPNNSKGTPQSIPPPLFYNKNYMLPIPSNYEYKNEEDFNISNNLNSLYHDHYYMPYYYHYDNNKRFKDDLHLDEGHNFITNYNS